ncbi:DNA cytosine methyltransferase [Delftia sp. ZNC0008]|uniref:DNA cytosine methyltransferase n=1 Tax=Delftia sp. ZNC0008 TaxID=1339242 RepID=UPI000646F9F1|nr:DNA cytosine methyltransferase [Delftia sp. ZNC0008]
MRFLSLFSGIEAASAAWAPLGWECAGVAEIDPFACAVLAARHPHVRNLGDITKITEMDIASLGSVDLVIFGSPCQDLSIAGKQKGLAGERSGLFFPAIDIITWSRLWCGTRFALWENVPGALSSNKGRDFAAVVDSLAGLDGTTVPPKGWGTEGCAVGTEAMVEWSTLDAQWFGVAQRRRRVFALADFGDWAGRQPILLEPKGLRGDSPPSREAGQNIAGSLTASAGRRGGVNDPERGQLVETVATLDASFGRLQGASGQDANHGHSHLIPQTAHTLRGEGFDASEDGTGRGTPLIPIPFDTTQITSAANYSSPKPGDPCHPLAAGAHAPAIAFDCKASGQNGFGVGPVTSTLRSMGHAGSHQNGGGHAAVAYSTKLHNTASNQAGKVYPEYTTALDANSPPPALLSTWAVRRLTPVECERLQGFPDGHTRAPNWSGWRAMDDSETPDQCMAAGLEVRQNKKTGRWRVKDVDGPRYKTLGNSMAVPVIRWIGQRIETALLFAS